MTESYFTCLTAAGGAAFANAPVTGQSIAFATIAVGDGAGSYDTMTYEEMRTRSDLINEVWRSEINHLTNDEVNSNWIIMETLIPAVDGDFEIREVGAFSDEGVLLAIGKYPLTYKPKLDQGAAKDLYIKMILEVTDTGLVELKVDPTIVMASRQHVADQLAAEKYSKIKGVGYPSASPAIADHGAASGPNYDAGNLKKTIDQAGVRPATINIPGDITITTAMEIPQNKTLDMRSGGTIVVDGCVLTINGAITADLRDDIFVLLNDGTVEGEYRFIDTPMIPTITALRKITGTIRQTVDTAGELVPGDGKGGATRIWQEGYAPGTYSHTDTDAITPDDGDGSAAWVPIKLDIQTFSDFMGAMTDGTTEVNEKIATLDANITTLYADTEIEAETILAQLSSDRIFFATKALMDADLSAAENVLASVQADPVADNNRNYIKQGASGTGFWLPSKVDTLRDIITNDYKISSALISEVTLIPLNNSNPTDTLSVTSATSEECNYVDAGLNIPGKCLKIDKVDGQAMWISGAFPEGTTDLSTWDPDKSILTGYFLMKSIGGPFPTEYFGLAINGTISGWTSKRFTLLEYLGNDWGLYTVTIDMHDYVTDLDETWSVSNGLFLKYYGPGAGTIYVGNVWVFAGDATAALSASTQMLYRDSLDQLVEGTASLEHDIATVAEGVSLLQPNPTNDYKVTSSLIPEVTLIPLNSISPADTLSVTSATSEECNYVEAGLNIPGKCLKIDKVDGQAMWISGAFPEETTDLSTWDPDKSILTGYFLKKSIGGPFTTEYFGLAIKGTTSGWVSKRFTLLEDLGNDWCLYGLTIDLRDYVIDPDETWSVSNGLFLKYYSTGAGTIYVGNVWIFAGDTEAVRASSIQTLHRYEIERLFTTIEALNADMANVVEEVNVLQSTAAALDSPGYGSGITNTLSKLSLGREPRIDPYTRIVCVGDSIMQQDAMRIYAVPGVAADYSFGEAGTAGDLGLDFVGLATLYPTADITVKNVAVGGSWVGQQDLMFVHDAPHLDPDLVIIYDWGNGEHFDDDMWYAHYEHLLQQIRATTSADIALCSYILTSGRTLAETVAFPKQMMIRQLAALYNCEYIDLAKGFDNYCITQGIDPTLRGSEGNPLISDDNVHPDPQGRILMGKLLAEHFPMLDGSNPSPITTTRGVPKARNHMRFTDGLLSGPLHPGVVYGAGFYVLTDADASSRLITANDEVGPLTVTFTGTRVSLRYKQHVAGGLIHFKIDGKAVSEHYLHRFTRPAMGAENHAHVTNISGWWLITVLHVTGHNIITNETIVITMASPTTYTMTGSVNGDFTGVGNIYSTSLFDLPDGGKITMLTEYWNRGYTPAPDTTFMAGDTFTFDAVVIGIDEVDASGIDEFKVVEIVHRLSPGEHTLEITGSPGKTTILDTLVVSR